MSLRDRLHAIGARLDRFEVPPPLRRPLKVVGYPLFAIVVATLTFVSTLPRDKVKAQLEAMLSQDPTLTAPMGLGMDVKASDLSLSIFGRGIRAENVVLRSRPLRPTDKPARYVLDEVKVNVGLFGLAFQRPTYSFSIAAFDGSIDGSVRVTANDNTYAVKWEDLSLGAVQGLQTGLGLPIEGKGEGKLDLDAPGRLLATSNGSLEIDVDGVSIGDGKAKLVVPGDPFLAQGVTVPKLRIGKVNVAVSIEKGKARIDSLRSHSPDGDLTIEGYIDLRDPLPSSQLHLYLRFKLADAVLKRESTLELVTSGLSNDAKRSDGFIGMQITGSIGYPAFKPSKTPPSGVVSKADSGAPAPTTPPPATTPPPVPVAPVVPPPAPVSPPPPVITMPPPAAPTPGPAPAADAAQPAVAPPEQPANPTQE